MFHTEAKLVIQFHSGVLGLKDAVGRQSGWIQVEMGESSDGTPVLLVKDSIPYTVYVRPHGPAVEYHPSLTEVGILRGRQ